VVVLGLAGAGKTTLLRLGYYAQEHETPSTPRGACWRTCGRPRPSWRWRRDGCWARSFLR
jgi:ABC-type molybdenum transport system ATPase subunit/photorepair protein PhrA